MRLVTLNKIINSQQSRKQEKKRFEHKSSLISFSLKILHQGFELWRMATETIWPFLKFWTGFKKTELGLVITLLFNFLSNISVFSRDFKFLVIHTLAAQPCYHKLHSWSIAISGQEKYCTFSYKIMMIFIFCPLNSFWAEMESIILKRNDWTSLVSRAYALILHNRRRKRNENNRLRKDVAKIIIKECKHYTMLVRCCITNRHSDFMMSWQHSHPEGTSIISD